MTRKELNEIKSQYTLEDCGILRLCGCYVDGERNKITQFNENFLNLPEEEKHKYFDIFKKTLSGTPGKNLVDMKFNVDAYADEGARTFLMNLRDSGLKDERLLDEFYDRIINNYSYVGNYLILLINQVYDIPGITADNIGWKMHLMMFTTIFCAAYVILIFPSRDLDMMRKITISMTRNQLIW